MGPKKTLKSQIHSHYYNSKGECVYPQQLKLNEKFTFKYKGKTTHGQVIYRDQKETRHKITYITYTTPSGLKITVDIDIDDETEAK